MVAWLLIQVADTVAPMLTLPDYVPRLVLFLLLILFPVALFLAWAYEVSPDGVVPDTGEERPPDPARNLFTGLFVAVVALAGLDLYLFNQPEPSGGDGEMAQVGDEAALNAPAGLEKSIAVLPFTAFSANPDEQYFADGLADTLLHKLAQLRDIRFISRTSSFQYRGEAVDVQRVGEELQVGTVLEGSVQRSGEQLRVIAQLVNTDDGGHIWSQTFDRGSDDIFAIHDEISEAVVRSLQVTLSPEERGRLTDAGTDSPEAYNLLATLEGRLFAQPGFELSMEEFQARTFAAIEQVEDQVLTIDPDFALAYRFISSAYSNPAFQASDRADNPYFLSKALEALNQAMLLEPGNPSNFTHLADIYRRQEDNATAEVFARMVLAQSPNDVAAIANLSLALVAQHKNAAEALALAEQEAVLNPNSGYVWRRLWFPLLGLGRSEEAIELIISQIGGNSVSQQLAANDLMRVQMGGLGEHAEAIEQVLQVRPNLRTTEIYEPSIQYLRDFGAAIQLAFALRASGQSDNANRLVQHAYEWYEVRAGEGYFY